MTELRVSEVKAMEEEINRLFDDLEREKYESEVELKRQLQARACFRESSKGACQLRDINYSSLFQRSIENILPFANNVCPHGYSRKRLQKR